MVQTVSDRRDLARGINSRCGRWFGWACSQAGAGGPSVAFEEFALIWDGVLDGMPGFQVFGERGRVHHRLLDHVSRDGQEALRAPVTSSTAFRGVCVLRLWVRVICGMLMSVGPHIGVRTRRDASSWRIPSSC